MTNFFWCIFIFEKKELRKKLSYFLYILKEMSLFRYLLFLFGWKEINPFRCKEFKKFIKQNKIKWQKKNYINYDSSSSILVEAFINHPAYSLSNAVISIFLNKNFKHNSIALIRKPDIKNQILFESYGFKKFIYFKDLNLLQRIKYIFISIKILKKMKNIDQAYRFKYKNIDVGLTAYDSYLRYVGDSTINKITPDFIVIFAETLFGCDYFIDIFKKDKISKLVQSETQFSPLNTLFQVGLKNKAEIYSRYGGHELTVRRYTNWKQRYQYRGAISQRLFDEVYKKNRKKGVKQIKEFYSRKVKSKLFGVDEVIIGLTKTKLQSKIKNGIRNKFNWDNRKIAVFFLSHLLDGNFNYGFRKNFKNIYYSTKFVLDKLPNLKNVNWLIKPHPAEFHFAPKKDFKSLIKHLSDKYDHIKVFPEKLNPSILLKEADLALTSSGTAGIEYPSFNINSIHYEKACYSSMNFMKTVSSKKKLITELENFHKLKKPSKTLIIKAQLYLFIRELLIKSKCSLIPKYIHSRRINEKKFWKDCSLNVKRFNFSNDFFYKMFMKQLKFNFRHTINLKRIDLKLKKFNDL